MALQPTVENLGRALDIMGELIAGVRDDQWSDPTPCTEWDVRALVNHVVGGNWVFARSLDGESLIDVRRQVRSSDQLGSDPVRAYQESSAAVLAAFSRPDVLERMVDVPAGNVPGTVALHLRIADVLVHSWDLARATGQPVHVPEDLAEQELSFSQQFAPVLARGTGWFQPEQPVPQNASTMDRLAACLGRTVMATETLHE